jgi:hypothetical protein
MTSTRTTLAALLIAVAALAGCAVPSDTDGTSPKPAATAATAKPVAAKATGKACTTNTMYPCPKLPKATKAAKPKPTPKPATVAQEQAIESAQSYLEMSGFSRAGLIGQLTSSYGDGYKKADALYAVNHISVDWNAEAVESAKQYLEMGGFSRSGLIQQLSSKYGDQYTLKQAKYAVKKVGL